MLTMDSLSSNLHSNRNGVQQRSTEIITYDNHLLRAKILLGSGLPQILQHAVYRTVILSHKCK